ncbi:hypothetical protein [Streptomyces xanthophaeus]|uniref:hypothetical protein n=1 Tax=Streptomyces xanthophaeus TaxID=67385 RepID=UPI0026491599|nr:hypothetical protein [Streptomyces xanthophaeus]WKD34199.1 hypothetical protein KO717_21055 [Streptomyces xanthophaeus]
MTPSNDRFRELRELLRSYTVTGYAFDDTEDSRGVALSAYLRQAANDPARAAEAAAEIDDLLKTGLFSDEIADDVDLLPHIRPPRGGTVEGCLAVIGGHLRQFLAEPVTLPSSPPRTAWTATLGLCLLLPRGVRLRQWLAGVRETVIRRTQG